MPFDISTAQPVVDPKGGFDLSTAKPVDDRKPAAWGPPSAWEKFKRDTPYAGDIAGALQNEFRGAIVNPLVGIGQAVAHVIGQGDRADRFVRDRQAAVQAESARSGELNPGAWQAVGSAMSPVNFVIPGGAGTNALARVGLATRAGAVAAATQPVTNGGDFTTEKAKQVGMGAGTGAVVGTAGEALGAIAKPIWNAVRSGVDGVKRWLGAEMPSSLESGAVHKVLETFGRDHAAGGPSATDVMDLLNIARSAGKPLTLADLGGQNVKSLAGFVTRQPGEAQAISRNLLDSRDQAAAARLSKDITDHVSSGDSMKQTVDALAQSRKAAAAPLYEEAMKPGSTAPLQDQFNAEFGRIQTERSAIQKELAAAERQMTSTEQRQAMAGNVGDLRVRGTDARGAANQAMEAAKAKLAALDSQEAKTTEVLRESQRAAAAGERGGVWSPRIQQFLDDPIVKQGIRKGLEVQRLESLAAGKPFNAANYAVTGAGQDGEPIIAKVPNMRLLDASKRGLDEILEGYRDKTSGRVVLDQRGRAIDAVRRSLIDELDRLNPSYKAARASWSGPSQSVDAMKAGNEIFNRSPEQVAENFARLSPNDKEFFRLGVADKLREKIAKTGVGGDEAKAIVKNEWTKSQLRPIFESQEKFDKFIDAATMESKMFETRGKLTGNSLTAERVAADKAYEQDMEAAGYGVGAAKNALTGRFIESARDAWRMRQALGWRKNMAMNAEIAKLLFDPALTQDALQAGAGQRLLQNFPGPQTQNYLSQAARQRLQALAPAAGMIAPGLLSGPGQ